MFINQLPQPSGTGSLPCPGLLLCVRAFRQPVGLRPGLPVQHRPHQPPEPPHPETPRPGPPGRGSPAILPGLCPRNGQDQTASVAIGFRRETAARVGAFMSNRLRPQRHHQPRPGTTSTHGSCGMTQWHASVAGPTPGWRVQPAPCLQPAPPSRAADYPPPRGAEMKLCPARRTWAGLKNFIVQSTENFGKRGQKMTRMDIFLVPPPL